MKKKDDDIFKGLPAAAADFIKLVIKNMGYRKKVRADVCAELVSHFEDGLKSCKSDEEKQQAAKKIIKDFGDAKLLGKLMKRAKKRCRPLWRTICARTFQVLGIILLFVIIRGATLAIGTTNVSVNYVDWLNNLGKADRDESSNAFPYFSKAADVFVDAPDDFWEIVHKRPADLNDVEISKLVDWNSKNQKAFEILKEGTEKPAYWMSYDANPSDLLQGEVIGATMKFLSDYKELARALDWQIGYKVYKGDIESAIDDWFVLNKFASLMQGKGFLIEQLVGTSIDALSNYKIYAMLQKSEFSNEQMLEIQKYIEANNTAAMNFEAEKAIMYDYIQRSFTDDGEGNGRPLIRGLPLAVNNWKSGLWGFFTFSYPDRRAVTCEMENYYDSLQRIPEKTPYQTYKKDTKPQSWDPLKSNSLLLNISAPAFEKISQINWRSRVSRTALVTVLAIKRYQKDNGALPESLAEVVDKGYLKTLPLDPYSDGQLIYKKTEGDFILYSVGSNMVDDNEQVFRHPYGERKGKVKQLADEGDWVFWPVEK